MVATCGLRVRSEPWGTPNSKVWGSAVVFWRVMEVMETSWTAVAGSCKSRARQDISALTNACCQLDDHLRCSKGNCPLELSPFDDFDNTSIIKPVKQEPRQKHRYKAACMSCALDVVANSQGCMQANVHILSACHLGRTSWHDCMSSAGTCILLCENSMHIFTRCRYIRLTCPSCQRQLAVMRYQHSIAHRHNK